MASAPTIDDLPNEILLKIISFFGPEDLCLKIAKVCERWNALAKAKILWKTLSYVLTNAPALRSLMICKRKDVPDIMKILNHKHVDLRILALKHCYLGKDSTAILANIVASYPDLEGLLLQGGNELTSAGYGLIPCLKKLSELHLSNSLELRGDTVRLIADSCQHLKKLSLNGVGQIDDNDVIHVISKLGEQLTTLVLGIKSLTDVAYLYLSNCTRLQELELNFCSKMTDRGLLDGVGSLHELTRLALISGRNLTAQALSTFLHQPSMSSIVLLNLTGCINLDDEGLEGIAERCIHLKEMAVSGCHKVTDAGISMVISHCNQLRILDLNDLPYITGEGYLALVPTHLPHLRVLRLEDCHRVHRKYVEELTVAVPELKVFNSWGNVRIGHMLNHHGICGLFYRFPSVVK